MSKLTKQEALAEVVQLKEQMREIFDKMTALADEHGFHITHDLPINTGYTYYAKQHIIDMLADPDYIPDHLEYIFKRGHYAKPGVDIEVERGIWMSSSHFC